MKQSILIVDDEPGIRESLTNVLEDEGYRVESVGSGEACLETLQTSKFDVVLLDIWLPGMDGIQVLEKLQARDSAPAVIMISGHGTIETAVRSTKLGAFDFIEKPLSIDKTLLTLRHALEQSQLAAQNRELRAELWGRDRIIGDSVPMKALRQQLQLAAPTNGRVLIFGESGTGKELVAHALHNHSQRAEQSFVEVNCAAIPEELIESELFGHIKGSFTGALEDKTGKFAQAHGGSLFLDEVGDMSLRTQSKVLRVIEEQRFTAVGSGTNLTVDVRIIAATNKHLDDEIQKGNFREDLFLTRRTVEACPTVPDASVLAVSEDELKASILLFYSLLDEQQRRLYAGLESLKLGRGGDHQLADFLDLDPHTVARGRQQLLAQDVEVGQLV